MTEDENDKNDDNNDNDSTGSSAIELYKFMFTAFFVTIKHVYLYSQEEITTEA